MSIHDKSLLVSLTLAGIASTRADREITMDVLREQSADADAGRWVARLWPKEALEPIRSLDARARAYHASKTLPWLDKGERIIASRTFLDYLDTMRGLRMEREALVNAFLANYDTWLAKARSMRGTAFNIEEYPTRQAATRKFRFEFNTQPIPHREDFRIALAGPDLESVREDLDRRLQEAERGAVRHLYQRLAEPVANLIERLADPDARITGATLNALRDITAALPDINFLDDPEVESLRQRIMADLCRLDPESVSTSSSDRSRAVAKANSILTAMAPWIDPDSGDESDAA